jgi:hypothetical protein
MTKFVDNEAAIFIAEEAFKAGYAACVADTGPAGVVPSSADIPAYAEAAWSAWEPSEAAKDACVDASMIRREE